jgi:transcriptional regulator with XRE-family HTH domain
MAAQTFGSDFLEQRRKSLGMSRAVVSQRSSVSLSTVNRVLSGDVDGTSVGKVRAIADALGVALHMQEQVDPVTFQEREAEKKARRLVGMVQSTMGLESQGVGCQEQDLMVRRTLHELMAGSRRRLWAG